MADLVERARAAVTDRAELPGMSLMEHLGELRTRLIHAVVDLLILIFFLSILGLVDAKFLIQHIRYAILVIFIIAAIICPLPDPLSMCLFAMPMLALYMIGVGVAWFFNPKRRKAKEAKAA